MMRGGACILGIGQTSACGVGAHALRNPAATQEQTIATRAGDVVVRSHPACVDGIESLIPARKLRRVDRFAQMALLASASALREASLADGARIALVFATGHGPLGATYGFQDGLIEGGDREASPFAFTASVHNMLASQVSIALGIAGPCLTLSALDLSPAMALNTATHWLARGDVEYVLVGCGDELCALGLYAAATLGIECAVEPGEGFVSFVLGRETTARSIARIESVEFLDDAASATAYAATDRSAHADGSRVGCMATQQAFDIAATALMLRDSANGKRVACVQTAADGSAAIVTLTAP